ncbi:MAG: hypothetical protein FD123_4059 [Bacteroidetes bacterium]|nr:MAG: hypothetical protein FD123_4059 [Bacteroidota bacterium]
MRRVSRTKQRKELGIAHQVGDGKNALLQYKSPVQGMFYPPGEDEDDDRNENNLYNSLISLKDWGIGKIKALFEEGDPDHKQIDDVARVMNIPTYVLMGHLDDWGSTDELPGWKQKFKALQNEFGRDPEIHGLVPRYMLYNLPEDSEASKIREIFNRFNNFPFVYISDSLLGPQGFLGKQGDCSTLLYMFMTALQAAGIDTSQEQRTQAGYGRMLVAGRPIHGRTEQHNLEGINYWGFNNHYWYDHAGQHFDLLFMIDHDPGVYWENGSGINYRGIIYHVFENGCVTIDTDQCALLGNFDLANFPDKRIGMGFASVNDALAYIDGNNPPM